MVFGLVLASDKFTVIGDSVDEFTVIDSSSLSSDKSVLFAKFKGKTFNDSSVRLAGSLGIVVTSISGSNGDDDDDTAEWVEGDVDGDVDVGTFVSDCNDNDVVISETGVESVVTVSRRREREYDEKNGNKE